MRTVYLNSDLFGKFINGRTLRDIYRLQCKEVDRPENSIAGEWTQKSQAIEWITNKLANPNSCDFTITLLPSSPADSNTITSPDHANPTPVAKPIVIGSIGSARDKEIGYMFHPSYWGKGYATEALEGFIKNYFEILPNEEYVIAMTDASNMGSRKVLEKVGFKKIGEETFDNPTLGVQDTFVYEFRVAR
jgi:ribosomal-protein-alanine N-acetyltransferase